MLYLLKIEAKSFRDTGHCKDIESTSNLGPIAGFQECNYLEASFILFLFSLPCQTPNNFRVVLICAVCSVFSFILFSTPLK